LCADFTGKLHPLIDGETGHPVKVGGREASEIFVALTGARAGEQHERAQEAKIREAIRRMQNAR
jgi:hypothetical protein